MLDRMVAVLLWTPEFLWAAQGERGKSELRRAVCRITSGTPALRLVDGKCHREYTAFGASLR